MSQEQRKRNVILFVEDDADIGLAFFHLLVEETPYDIVLVTNPLEALALMKDIIPVLFILDYQLPDMNGIQLFDRLHVQPELEKIPALMVSATLPEKELRMRGIVGVEKPVDIDVFLDTVKDLARGV